MVRYLLRQPRTLQSLATDKLARCVTSQVENLLPPIAEVPLHNAVNVEPSDALKAEVSRHIEMKRNYLESIPWMCHDTLAVEVIRLLTEDLKQTKALLWFRGRSFSVTNVIGQMIETLFTKGLTRLSLDIEDKELFPPLLCHKSNLITNLIELHIYLDFQKDWNIQETDIIQLLKELHKLKSLTIRNYESTENILKCIADNCKSLEVLHLSYAKDINDSNIDLLTRLYKLKSIELAATNLSKNGIAALLLSKENIERFYIRTVRHSSAIAVFQALEHIASLQVHAGKRFKLKYYNHNNEISLKQLQLIVKMCPQIEEIKLNCLEPWQRDLIMPLYDLHELRDLELGYYRFYSDQIKEMLEVRGRQLVHLNLESFQELDLNALKYISQVCPHLQSLTMERSSFERDLKKVNVELKITPFRNLKRLIVGGWLDDMPTDEQLYFLLSNCPCIEYIRTGYAASLTDDVMLKALDLNPMIYLKELNMCESKVTSSVIDKIITNCSSCPKVILKIY